MRHVTHAAILFFAWMTLAPALYADEIPVDLELVLAIDVSGSVDQEEARLQREGYLTALESPAVLQAIKGGIFGRIAVIYIEWAGSEHALTVNPWALIDGPEAVRAFNARLQTMPPTRGMYTSITTAIEYAMPMFDNNGFEGTRRVIDISGDGPNNIGGLITVARDRAVAKGITINGLPIMNDRRTGYGMPSMPNLDLYYQECVIGGSRAFLIVADTFESFADAIRRKLLLEIAGIDPRHIPGTLTRHDDAQPRLWLAQNRWVPPCDEGERLLEQRRRGFRDW